MNARAITRQVSIGIQYFDQCTEAAKYFTLYDHATTLLGIRPTVCQQNMIHKQQNVKYPNCVCNVIEFMRKSTGYSSMPKYLLEFLIKCLVHTGEPMLRADPHHLKLNT